MKDGAYMKQLTIAMVQQNSIKENQLENTRSGLEYITEAKRKGADIVLFPECWITSYSFPEIAESLPPINDIEKHPEFVKWNQSSLLDNSPHIQEFRSLAKELSIGIVITSFTRGEKRPQNSAFLIDRSGEIILKYSKVHTCDFNVEKYIEGGTEFFVCHFDNFCVGIMICYDREYPESARELMLQGAELILVPNDCKSMRPRLQELSTRAMENMVGIAMANPPGENGGCSCAFNPMVWDLDGNVIENSITIADEMTKGIFYAKFNMEEMREYRNREDIGKHRKVKAYKNQLRIP